MTPGAPQFRPFDSIEALAQGLAAHIRARLTVGIEGRGGASLVVSGGSTPIPLFAQLSQESLDWTKVYVTLADERWVASTHEDSNEKAVREHLLRGRACGAHFVGLKTADPSPEQGERECARRLAELPQPFDVVVLGMGEDGHTASLFPGASKIRGALDRHGARTCVAITPPKAPHPRMTLTLRTLLTSRELALHITGASKRGVYEKALRAGPIEEMPIRAFLRQQAVPLVVWWAP